MRKIKVLLVTTLVLSFSIQLTSCENSQEPNKPSSQLREDANLSIEKLNQLNNAKIVGLWKVLKVELETGESRMKSENDYIELKPDHSFSASSMGTPGKWSLAYGIDNQQKLITYLILQRKKDYGTYLGTFDVSLINENGTTYFKLFDLQDKRTTTLIHQN